MRVDLKAAEQLRYKVMDSLNARQMHWQLLC